MKILLISPCHKNFGGWYRTHNIAESLARRGHKIGFAYSPKYFNNVWGKVLTGLKNTYYVHTGNYDLVYCFETVHPETLFPLLYAKLTFSQTLVDVGDEWLDSPTYKNSGWGLRGLIRFLDFIPRFFDLTVTSDYLRRKYGKGVKLINGVNTREFSLVSKPCARAVLGYKEDDKVVLSFGNTYGGNRQKLLGETIKQLPGDIKVIAGVYLNSRQLPFYTSACDLLLFPTDSCISEKACFPIRIGTYLNSERVIATIDNDTQFKRTLRPFDCMVLGKDPKDLADNIVKFFKNKRRRKELESNTLKAKQVLDWDNVIRRLSERIVQVYVKPHTRRKH